MAHEASWMFAVHFARSSSAFGHLLKRRHAPARTILLASMRKSPPTVVRAGMVQVFFSSLQRLQHKKLLALQRCGQRGRPICYLITEGQNSAAGDIYFPAPLGPAKASPTCAMDSTYSTRACAEERRR